MVVSGTPADRLAQTHGKWCRRIGWTKGRRSRTHGSTVPVSGGGQKAIPAETFVFGGEVVCGGAGLHGKQGPCEQRVKKGVPGERKKKFGIPGFHQRTLKPPFLPPPFVAAHIFLED